MIAMAAAISARRHGRAVRRIRSAQEAWDRRVAASSAAAIAAGAAARPLASAAEWSPVVCLWLQRDLSQPLVVDAWREQRSFATRPTLLSRMRLARSGLLVAELSRMGRPLTLYFIPQILPRL
jgi:hypothetical protein